MKGRPGWTKTGHVIGRPTWESSLLEHPGAKFSAVGIKREQRSKKERTEGLWKLTLLMEIRPPRGFPQQLEKRLAHDARLFHSSHRPDDGLLSQTQF